MFYKETNFQGTTLGRVPKDWQVDKLENLCEKIKAGGTPLTTNKGFWNGNIPFAKIEDMTISGKYLLKTFNHVSRDGLDNSSSWMVPEKSLLLAMYGSFGEIAINKIPVATNQAIIGVIPRQRDDVEFLYYWYLFFKPEWRRYVKPTTQANLTAEIVRGSFVPMPYQPERKAIVEVLSCVDLAIQKTDEVVAKTERLKKGLMQKLLTEGIGHKEYKDTEIGKIPKEWNVVGLGSLVRVQGGFAFKSQDYVKDGVPLVRIANVSFGHIEFADLAKLPHDYLKQYSEFALEENDIVIVLTRPITEGGMKAGMIERIHTPALLNQRVGRFRIRDNSQTSPDFLFQAIFSDDFIRQVQRGLATMNQPNISTKEMERFTIALPPFEEQTRIAETLSTADGKLGIERREKAKLERIKQGLMDLLLSGKIRVKVD